jgi:hypothetical protein
MADQVQEVQAEPQAPEATREEKALAELGKAELEQAASEHVPEEPEVAAPKEPEESKTSTWARLSERDKEIRQLRQKLKEQEKADSLLDLAKTNPAKALQEMGIGIDQVLEILASQPAPARQEEQPGQTGDSEVAKLKQELESFKAEQQARSKQEIERREYEKIHTLATSDKDRWELIASLSDQGTYALVMDTAAEFWRTSGEIPEYADVLDTVEKHLEEEMVSRYERLGSLKKLQSRYQMSKITDKAKDVAKMPPKAASQTLSTSFSSQGPQPMGNTEADRFARALDLLEKTGD